MNAKSKIQFVAWLDRFNPELFRTAVRETERRFPTKNVRAPSRGLGEITTADMLAQQDAFAESTSTPSVLDTVINNASKIGQAFLGVSQAKTLLDINIQRAKNGQAPLDMSALSPQFNIGIPTSVQYILWAGVGVLAISLLRRGK